MSPLRLVGEESPTWQFQPFGVFLLEAVMVASGPPHLQCCCPPETCAESHISALGHLPGETFPDVVRAPHPPRLAFPCLSPVNIWCQVPLDRGGCPMRCRVCSSIPGLYPPGASSTFPPTVTTKNVPRCCPRRVNCPVTPWRSPETHQLSHILFYFPHSPLDSEVLLPSPLPPLVPGPNSALYPPKKLCRNPVAPSRPMQLNENLWDMKTLSEASQVCRWLRIAALFPGG